MNVDELADVMQPRIEAEIYRGKSFGFEPTSRTLAYAAIIALITAGVEIEKITTTKQLSVDQNFCDETAEKVCK